MSFLSEPSLIKNKVFGGGRGAVQQMKFLLVLLSDRVTTLANFGKLHAKVLIFKI